MNTKLLKWFYTITCYSRNNVDGLILGRTA